MRGTVCYNQNMNVRVKSYAKLNLTLAVTGKIEGYHTLDSLVCSVDLFDIIKLSKRKDSLVTVEMHGRGTELIPHEKNTAALAAEAYVKAFGTCGADIKIYKNIPVGGGLGGSSADAAGVLRGMSKLYGFGSEVQLKTIADSLGSDTGYMLTGGYARLSGRGENVKTIDCKRRLHFLLLLPGSGVSTAECFSRYDTFQGVPQVSNNSEEAIQALNSGDLQALGISLSNALYPAASKINPQLQTAYEELQSFNPLGVNMTGSGSAVYALFENGEFASWAASRYKGKLECIQIKTVI